VQLQFHLNPTLQSPGQKSQFSHQQDQLVSFSSDQLSGQLL